MPETSPKHTDGTSGLVQGFLFLGIVAIAIAMAVTIPRLFSQDNMHTQEEESIRISVEEKVSGPYALPSESQGFGAPGQVLSPVPLPLSAEEGEGVVGQTQTQNLVWTDLPAPEPSPGASMAVRYADSVPVGTSATAEPIRIPSDRVTRLTAWFALPPASGTQSITLRLYRYRRVDGVFNYTQLNDSVVITSALAWSVIHDFSSTLRDIDINQETDVIAISTVNSLGGGSNHIRALMITVETGLTHSLGVTYNLLPDQAPTWPVPPP